MAKWIKMRTRTVLRPGNFTRGTDKGLFENAKAQGLIVSEADYEKILADRARQNQTSDELRVENKRLSQRVGQLEAALEKAKRSVNSALLDRRAN
jgi:hypothetical protein